MNSLVDVKHSPPQHAVLCAKHFLEANSSRMASGGDVTNGTGPLRQQPKRRAKQNINYTEPLSPELLNEVEAVEILGKRKREGEEGVASSRSGMFLQLDSVPPAQQGHKLQAFLDDTRPAGMKERCGFSNRSMVCQPCEALFLKSHDDSQQEPNMRRSAKRIKLVGRLATKITPPESPLKRKIKLVGRLAAQLAPMEATEAIVTPAAVHQNEIPGHVPRVSYNGNLYAVDTCAEPVLIKMSDNS